MPDDNKTTDTNTTPTQDVSGVSQTIPPMEPSISTPIPPPASPTDQGQTTDTPPSAANSTVPPPPPIIEEQKEGEVNIPPIVTMGEKPKGKVSKKVIATILGILFLVGGVSAGVILVQQQHEIREKASGCGWGDEGNISCSGYTQPVYCAEVGDSCNRYDYPIWCNEAACTGNEICVVGTGCVSSQLPTATPRPTGEVSDNCVFVTENRYCVGNNPTGDCYQGGVGDRYACYRLAGNYGKIVDTAASKTNCDCPSDYSWKNNEYGYTWCFDTSSQCTGGVLPNGTDTSEQCSLEPEECEPSSTPTPGPTSTPTPTPTDETYASCSEIQAFDTEWNPIVDLSSLVAGDVIRFTVAGDTNSGSFDKARFRVNSPTWRTVVVAKKPGTDNFYDEYTIPEGVTSFTINVQLHHTSSDINWF